MATKYVTLEGIAEWAKLFEHNRDKTGYKGAYEATDGRTTINLIIAPEDMNKLQNAGSMKRGTPDGLGRGVNVKLDRKWNTGRDWDSGAPEVLRPDGNPWDVAVDGEIGNGSKVRVQVAVTDMPKQGVVSTRLEKVKVLDLVAYEGRDSEFYKDETGDTPVPSPEAKAVKEKAPAQELQDSDEIPF